jgi:hypothetical protein
MDVVEASQHRLAVRDEGRSVTGADRRLPCHRVQAADGPNLRVARSQEMPTACRERHHLSRSMPWKRTVDAAAPHAYLRRRNANTRHLDVLAAQRRERARIRSEKGVRWGGRSLAAAA